jgi:hypothetical protein
VSLSVNLSLNLPVRLSHVFAPAQLSVHRCDFPPINKLIYLCLLVSLFACISLSVRLSVVICLSVCLTYLFLLFYLCAGLFVCQIYPLSVPVCLTVSESFLFVCLYIFLPTCLSVYFKAHLFVTACLSVSISLPIHLSGHQSGKHSIYRPFYMSINFFLSMFKQSLCGCFSQQNTLLCSNKIGGTLCRPDKLKVILCSILMN